MMFEIMLYNAVRHDEKMKTSRGILTGLAWLKRERRRIEVAGRPARIVEVGENQSSIFVDVAPDFELFKDRFASYAGSKRFGSYQGKSRNEVENKHAIRT